MSLLRPLPTGTTTFLFTDIEGSTKLWEEYADQMQSALARHDYLISGAIDSNSGIVFKTVGDAFCAVFPNAPDALAAALFAQRAIHEESWMTPQPIRARMAVHTGTAELRNGDYYGGVLNRVARLLSIGHGGQTLVSAAAYELTRDSVPDRCVLQDMGSHRLKDLARPEQVFALLHPDLPSDFPPLRSLDNPQMPNNLPQQATSFVGRDRESKEVKTLLSQVRLLSLTGSGGTGKTRLALQVAADVLENYPDGVWLVELAPLFDPALVPQAVAAVLGVREMPGEPILQTLLTTLKDRQMLLVLDNCEHVLDAAARLADAILHSCPKLKLLVSSREALGIGGENTYRVPSLSLPDVTQVQPQTPESLSQYESARLFIERAVATKADFVVTNQNAPALASVCYRLDGIPLAIELAAARIRSMTVEELEKRLADRFRLLTGGSRTALPRQQTLRALIDWSYNLLDEGQKALVARLSIFCGGWTLEAAEAICSGEPVHEWDVLDVLTALVDKSLVVAEERQGKTRYRLLETVHQYVREKLAASGEAEDMGERHQAFYRTLAEEAELKMEGPEQASWLERLEREYENLRAAVDFCQQEPDGAEFGLRLTGALGMFWEMRGHLSEGRERLTAALARPEGQHATNESLRRARANALYWAGCLASRQGDYSVAESLNRESLALWRELDDKKRIAALLCALGSMASSQGSFAAAQSYLDESLRLRREIGDKWGIANSLLSLGVFAEERGDFAAACPLQEEALALYRELGDKLSIAYSLVNLGFVLTNQGDWPGAHAALRECLTLFSKLGAVQTIGVTLDAYAVLACHEQQPRRAALLFGAGQAVRDALGTAIIPVNQKWHSRSLQELEESLGTHAYEAALREGRDISLEQAIAYALDEA